jgi:hypothetical protein
LAERLVQLACRLHHGMASCSWVTRLAPVVHFIRPFHTAA